MESWWENTASELKPRASIRTLNNKQAIIAATAINSPQIRISNIVKELEKQENKTYAKIEENEIVLE